MITGKAVKKEGKLSKELILSKVDDYNIIKHYLGQDFDYKHKYPSPLRENGIDNTPNLCFFIGDNDEILFKDFASNKGGDCFKFVSYIFGLNFYQVLEKIDKDFGLGLQDENPVFKIQVTKRPDSIHKQAKLIQIIPKDFTFEELSWWKQYHIIREELDRKLIYSIDKLYMNKKLVPNYDKELRFAYQFDNYLKIYSPNNKRYKWISSCPNDYISGFDDIKYKVFSGKQSDKLIITKSVKDEIIMSKFFPDVCSTQNESNSSINQENMEWILKGYERKNIFIAYDNDEAGVEASTYYTKNYGFSYVNVPKIFRREGIKDWSDLVKEKDLDTMENYLKIRQLL